jgi:uncharacterized repeat protein (TIGR01451 family)
MRVHPEEEGRMVRLAFVLAAAFAGAPWGLAATTELDPADLGISQSSSPSAVGTGDPVTYTVVAHNLGPAPALDATVIDPLPLGSTFLALSFSPPDAEWNCTVPAVGANGKVSCTNKSLEPRESVTLTITTRIAVCIGSQPLVNTVQVVSLNPDPQPGDNVATSGPAVIDSGACDDGDACTAFDRCAPGIAFEENFDSIATNGFPPGWTTTLVVGPLGGSAWRIVSFSADSLPNSAYAPDASDVRDAVLDSPAIPIVASNAQLVFRNRFDLEAGQDGGVLEVSLGGSAFEDILAAGATFEAGGYTGTIRTEFQSPIAARQAWTGSSSGFITSIVDFPASWAGSIAVLRWRVATDLSQGRTGQWIDSISITGVNSCHPGGPRSCDDGNACTVDSCDAVAGCVHHVSCDDGNPCTDDSCGADLQCVHASNTAPCDDGIACTQTDTCVAGVCVGTNPLACASANACAYADCDPARGCVSHSANLDTSSFSSGRVDGRDLAVLAEAWSSCPGDARYAAAANLDPQDPCIELSDFHRFMDAFGRNCFP